jgi:hypothetical protein
MGGKLGESVKVTVEALRKALGINSKSVANDRLMEAIECSALELDEEKIGSGRGAPRYFKLLRTPEQIATASGTGVFPPPEDVQTEINCLSSVSSGHTDKKDKKDEINRTPAAAEESAPVWRRRL